MVQADNVTYAFANVVALNDVTLSVAAGQCVALVGESGAGSTTLLRCFNRMVVPLSGAVLVEDIDVSSLPVAELRRRIGYVLQHGGLFRTGRSFVISRSCPICLDRLTPLPPRRARSSRSASRQRATRD